MKEEKVGVQRRESSEETGLIAVCQVFGCPQSELLLRFGRLSTWLNVFFQLGCGDVTQGLPAESCPSPHPPHALRGGRRVADGASWSSSCRNRWGRMEGLATW